MNVLKESITESPEAREKRVVNTLLLQKMSVSDVTTILWGDKNATFYLKRIPRRHYDDETRQCIRYITMQTREWIIQLMKLSQEKTQERKPTKNKTQQEKPKDIGIGIIGFTKRLNESGIAIGEKETWLFLTQEEKYRHFFKHPSRGSCILKHEYVEEAIGIALDRIQTKGIEMKVAAKLKAEKHEFKYKSDHFVKI